MILQDHLVNCVNRNDAYSFLGLYLLCVDEDQTFVLPTYSTSITDVAANWRECIPIRCTYGVEGFYRELAFLWIETVQQATLLTDTDVLPALILAHKRLELSFKSRSQLQSGGVYTQKEQHE